MRDPARPAKSKVKHGARKRQAAQRQTQDYGLIALYLVPELPRSRCTLETAGEGTRPRALSFTPIAHCEAASGWVGLLTGPDGYRIRTGQSEALLRGTATTEPAELYVAGPVPEAVQQKHSPAVKGLLKSICRAMDDIGPAEDTDTWFQLGVTLAVDGGIAVKGLDKFGANALTLTEKEQFELRGGQLVWMPFLNRVADELVQSVGELVRKNPLVTNLSPQLATTLMTTGDAPVSRLAPAVAAAKAGWKEVRGWSGKAWQVADARSRADAAVLALVDEALGQVEGGEGGLVQLRRQFESRQHILSWMLEAEQLVESPDGYLFTARELEHFRGRLGEFTRKDIPGVGDLKRKLKIGRRKAEGLYSLLSGKAGEGSNA